MDRSRSQRTSRIPSLGGFLPLFLPLASALLLLLVPAGTSLAQEGSPAGPIPVEFLQARRDQLLAALDGNPAFVFSAREGGGEGEYPQASDYREDNDFFYLTGLEAPGGWLLLNVIPGSDVVLYLPPTSPRAQQWTGARVGPGGEARRRTGVSDIRSTELLGSDLDQWRERASRSVPGKELFVFLPGGDARVPDRLEPLLTGGAVETRRLEPLLASLRLVKDAEEVRRLRTAAAITMEAHREVWRSAAPGLHEYQLEAILEFVFRFHGAERVGFPSIVGSGPNSVVLHYDDSRRRTEAGDLVVVDIGAEYGYYTADITRTFPVSGRFTPRQKALYDLVLEARQAALAVIRPGATLGDVNAAVRSHFREHSGELCGEESCASHLTHGVAHWLGMDVHDVGENRTPLAPGMVLTLEPGLYFPEEALGIRIEDDILVTPTGHEVLTDALPRSTEDIEGIMTESPRFVQKPEVRLRDSGTAGSRE